MCCGAGGSSSGESSTAWPAQQPPPYSKLRQPRLRAGLGNQEPWQQLLPPARPEPLLQRGTAAAIAPPASPSFGSACRDTAGQMRRLLSARLRRSEWPAPRHNALASSSSTFPGATSFEPVPHSAEAARSVRSRVEGSAQPECAYTTEGPSRASAELMRLAALELEARRCEVLGRRGCAAVGEEGDDGAAQPPLRRCSFGDLIDAAESSLAAQQLPAALPLPQAAYWAVETRAAPLTAQSIGASKPERMSKPESPQRPGPQPRVL